MDYQQILQIAEKAGFLIWPILACSLIGTTIFFERLLLFRKVKKNHDKQQKTFVLIHGGQNEKALDMLKNNSNRYDLGNRILMDALMTEDPDRETLEMVVSHSVEREMTSLSRFLDTLAVLGSTAPLLGLLGTVIGMIKAFSVVEAMGGNVNAAVLAGGIWEAMLTTAFGLIVAIPLIFFHNHLSGKLLTLQEALEDIAIQCMQAWAKGHLKNNE